MTDESGGLINPLAPTSSYSSLALSPCTAPSSPSSSYLPFSSPSSCPSTPAFSPAFYTVPSHDYMRLQLDELFLSLYPAASHPFPSPLVSLIVEYAWQPLLTSSKELIHAFHFSDAVVPPGVDATHNGLAHDDTRYYDTWDDALRLRILKGWRVLSVTAHGGRFCNGLSLRYAHPSSPALTFAPEVLLGGAGAPVPSVELLLEEGEHLSNVAFLYSDAFDRVTLTTSEQRRAVCGGGGLSTSVLLRQHTQFGYALADALIDGEPGTGRILALRAGVGGALHSLGAVWERMYPRTLAEQRRTGDLQDEADTTASVSGITRSASASSTTADEFVGEKQGWLHALLSCLCCDGK